MTEQEEDEELLTDLNQGKKNMVVFDESPAYIKVRLSTYYCHKGAFTYDVRYFWVIFDLPTYLPKSDIIRCGLTYLLL